MPVQSTLLLVNNPKHKRAASTKTNKTKSRKKSNESTGRWTAEEHREFLRGLQIHGREWKKVATLIPSRSSAQVRSHAQKYFVRLQKLQEEDPNGELKSLGDEGTSTCSSSHVQHRVEDVSIDNMPLSVRRQAERILAQPETVQAEVTLTLERLRVRYRQLQEQLRRRQQSAAQNNEASAVEGAPDNESVGAGSIESLHHGELIALHVLQGGLASANESENESESKVSTTKMNESIDPNIQASKRRRLD
jgi:SHAQKYF class myb-like DNA-binding protein